MKIYNLIIILTLLLLVACQTQDSESNEDVKNKSSNSAQELEKDNNTNDRKASILFFGNSLTEGYGVEKEEAYPALIQNTLDSLGYAYEVVNAGLSGETTAGGLERVDWVIEQDVDIFVLELGGNDGLRGIPTEETRKNLKAIIDKVRQKHSKVKILLAGMQVPPNMGTNYSQDFRKIFPEVAQDKEVELLPFLLEGVGGEADLNLPDGIHPNPEGHKIVAKNVWKALKPLLQAK